MQPTGGSKPRKKTRATEPPASHSSAKVGHEPRSEARSSSGSKGTSEYAFVHLHKHAGLPFIGQFFSPPAAPSLQLPSPSNNNNVSTNAPLSQSTLSATPAPTTPHISNPSPRQALQQQQLLQPTTTTSSRPAAQKVIAPPPPPHMAPILALPSETLDTVLTYLPTRGLHTLLFVSRLMSAFAERHLYATIQHLQLFPRPESNLHLSLLHHLASHTRVASCVRHFAVQGLPWQTDETIAVLSRALVNMTGLLSLDLDLGPGFEESLFDPAPWPSTLTRLQAVNLTDAPTVAVLAKGRPIETLRIIEPVEELDFFDMIPALAQSTLPVRQLQLSLTLPSDQAAFAAIRCLVHHLPKLTTLGLDLRVPRQFITDFTSFATELASILSCLSELKTLGLALPPPTQAGDSDHVALLHNSCPSVERMELQWNAWTWTKDGWVVDQSRPSHKLMRRNWVYTHAKSI